MSEQNFVIKNMIKLNIGKTIIHKDKNRLSKMIRKNKHKNKYYQE